MRIAHYLPALIAVLCLAAVLVPVSSLAESRSSTSRRYRRSVKNHHWLHNFEMAEDSLPDAGRLLTIRENQDLLQVKGGADGRDVDCCPSVLEMVQPEGGKNQLDMYVELYRDGNSTQRFYEVSCHKDVVNKPCRFMDRKLHNQSRCVQKYSFTYALVRESASLTHDSTRQRHHRSHHSAAFPAPGFSGSSWMLDYIRVRSGCSCVVTPKAKKKRNKNQKKKKVKSDDHSVT